MDTETKAEEAVVEKTEEVVVENPVVKAEEVAAPAKTEAKTAEKAVVPAKFKDLVAKIEEMSVLDLHELVKVLEEKFGVSAQAAAAAGPAVAGEAAEVKDSFTVELTSAGETKIAVMKVIKEVLALGLKEAKDLVDGAPSVLKVGMKKAEADEIKKKIEEVGGKITLK